MCIIQYYVPLGLKKKIISHLIENAYPFFKKIENAYPRICFSISMEYDILR